MRSVGNCYTIRLQKQNPIQFSEVQFVGVWGSALKKEKERKKE